MSYEHFRDELQRKLISSFCSSDALTILMAVDGIAEHYDISEKSVALSTQTTSELPEMAKAYLASCIVAVQSDKTVERKKQILTVFFLDVIKSPAAVSTNDIRVWLFDYQRRRNISSRSLDSYRATIRAFFEWCVDEEYLQKNPAKKIAPIKYEKKERQSLTQFELEQIRAACVTVRDKAIIEFLYSTGCRVSELCDVKRFDIDWTSGSVHLFGKGKKHRTSYLNAKAQLAVKTYLSSRNDMNEHLFVSERQPHGALEKSAVEKIVRDIVKRSRVDNKHITPHVFRHTTATQMLKSGVPVTDIQHLLGHESVSTTMIYAHSDMSSVKASHIRAVI